MRPMESARHDFGEAVSVDAEAVGQPGQRRFRLMVRSSGQAAAIWMEKQQLAGIGEWFEETVKKLDDAGDNVPDVEPTPFGAIFDVEVNVLQVALGYQEDGGHFVIQVFDDQSSVEEPAFHCKLSRGQCRVLARKISEVIAGGRPICPLCGRPIEATGHVCPRSNGHTPH
jgi:uncharacterized repeat protein (TIGR03847 family)